LALRLSAIVCLSLPISALICFILMKMTGLSANTDVSGRSGNCAGMIVDANIVVVENIFRHLSERNLKKDKLRICLDAVREVAVPCCLR